jgi:hypothetical protein
MPPAGFEPAIPASKGLYTHTLDCTATGIGHVVTATTTKKYHGITALLAYVFLSGLRIFNSDKPSIFNTIFFGLTAASGSRASDSSTVTPTLPFSIQHMKDVSMPCVYCVYLNSSRLFSPGIRSK